MLNVRQLINSNKVNQLVVTQLESEISVSCFESQSVVDLLLLTQKEIHYKMTQFTFGN